MQESSLFLLNFAGAGTVAFFLSIASFFSSSQPDPGRRQEKPMKIGE
jgi:hypothetical protein